MAVNKCCYHLLRFQTAMYFFAMLLMFFYLTAGPASATAFSESEIRSKQDSVRQMTDLDEETRTNAAQILEQVIGFIKSRQQVDSRIKEISGLIAAAPQRLASLKKNADNLAEKIAPYRISQLKIFELEQILLNEQAQLNTERTTLNQWIEKMLSEQDAYERIPEQKIDVQHRMDILKFENQQHKSPDFKSDPLENAKAMSTAAQIDFLQGQAALLEQQLQGYPILMEIYRAQKELALKTIEVKESIVKSIQSELQQRRQKEAALVLEDAQDAVAQISNLPQILKDQYDINLKLSADLETISIEEADLAQKYARVQEQLKIIKSEYETARKRVELDVLTEVVGVALRNQRQHLPSAKAFQKQTRKHQLRLSEISEKQIELERLSRQPAALDEIEKKLTILLEKKPRAAVKSLVKKSKELLEKRIVIIEKNMQGYDRIIKMIQDIEITKKLILSTTRNFDDLLSRHLLWIKSSKPFGPDDLIRVQVFLFKFRVKDLWRSLSRQKGMWGLGVFVGAFLVAGVKRAQARLSDIAGQIDRQVDDTITASLRAAGFTLFLSVVWPYMIFFPVFMVAFYYHTVSSAVTTFASGMLNFWVPFFWFAVYQFCRPQGLAHTHFGWPSYILNQIRHHLIWLIPLEILAAVFFMAANTVFDPGTSNSLGKTAVMVQSVSLAVFFCLVFRMNDKLLSALGGSHATGLFFRFRYFWFAAITGFPIILAGLCIIGYYHSALEIRELLYQTVASGFFLFVISSAALRMLLLARRRISFKKMSEKRTESSVPSSSILQKPAIEENAARLMDMDEQTRSILKLLVFILAVAGMWQIWESVFPALGIFNDIQFWSYNTQINGVEKTIPITLANVCLAGVVLFSMLVAVRNLPGLIEVILLNRLGLDAGARYAYITVSRYAIIALGLIIALNTIGIRWSSLQWLIAALSVGLGFGLQEIVANFISGLIVLFERPFRVGDTVTVGDVNGTVTKIRIRATTIEDWDRKELIVPNKEFITGKLINWSLSDQMIRIRVPVGIAYGSDTQLAETLLMKAAKENALVARSPKPTVVFLKFGDSALDFEVRVYIKNIDDWIPMLHSINRAIDRLFRENNITIAFPQQDVHLDTLRPLSIRLEKADKKFL